VALVDGGWDKQEGVVKNLSKVMKYVFEKGRTREIVALRTFLAGGRAKSDERETRYLEGLLTNA
jgi:hypothetical protein